VAQTRPNLVSAFNFLLDTSVDALLEAAAWLALDCATLSLAASIAC